MSNRIIDVPVPLSRCAIRHAGQAQPALSRCSESCRTQASVTKASSSSLRPAHSPSGAPIVLETLLREHLCEARSG